jgi:stearoyl-CoA desaturase (delta-9 desaturase)
MTRAHRITNLIGVFLPFVAFALAIALLWNRLVGWHDLALLGVMYVVTGLGITVGFHRMLTHRAFQTFAWVRAAWAALGSMAVQGSAITWVSDHRKHHAFTDEEGDPHSPHVGNRPGPLGMLTGLWHAHMGWLFSSVGAASPQRFAPDLLKDRAVRVIDRTFWAWVAVGFAVPAGIGWALTGRWTGALTGLLWGGLVRVFLLHHVTWSINSVCHFFGRRRFATDDESRNVFWLAPISFGESWHHNHHAFPRSAFHGLGRWEIDPAALVIVMLEKLGLIWDVVRISPERQREKAVPTH